MTQVTAEQAKEWQELAEYVQGLTITPKAYDLNTSYAVTAVAGQIDNWDNAITKAIAFVGAISELSTAVPALLAQVTQLRAYAEYVDHMYGRESYYTYDEWVEEAWPDHPLFSKAT